MKTTKGFTIIELIIVISIISVLSLFGVSTYNTVQQDARNSKRKADLKDIRSSLEIYRSEKNAFPSTYPLAGTIRWSGLCNPNPWGPSPAAYIPGLEPDYMSKLPRDPRTNNVNSSSGNNGCSQYPNMNCYLYASNGVDYKIIAHCSPEGTMDPNDAFYDPVRPTHAWQISSSNTSLSW